MNAKRMTMLILGILVAAVPVVALDEESLEITGFGDCLMLADPQDEADGHVRIGQAELDVTAGVDDRTELAVAVAYDSEAEAFGLGAFTIERSLLSRESGMVREAGLVVGRFDVPFGLDWRVYPSLDRKMVTAPLVVAMTHGCWNEVGAQGYVRSERLELKVFGVNDLPCDEASSKLGSKVATSTRHAVGGRLGVLPAEGLELGASGAVQVAHDGDRPTTMAGVDAAWSVGSFETRGEFIRQEYARDTKFAGAGEGWYLEAARTLGKHRLGVRYDRFVWSDGEGLDRRWSVGVARILSENAEWRLERRMALDEAPDDMMVQLVTAF